MFVHVCTDNHKSLLVNAAKGPSSDFYNTSLAVRVLWEKENSPETLHQSRLNPTGRPFFGPPPRAFFISPQGLLIYTNSSSKTIFCLETAIENFLKEKI
jgi:hypothetical protein